ncbi:MAG: type II toxin-antitoxin system ParD family antitoxin [Flavobacteriaceae bacterium]|nr:type II toxin-antitoxin system ParD family antitoxin [Flavobacteriaceae bacterium]
MENKTSEEEESKMTELRNALQQGIDSGMVTDFDAKKHLQDLHSRFL